MASIAEDLLGPYKMPIIISPILRLVAGKLSVWDGTFEMGGAAGTPPARSWGRPRTMRGLDYALIGLGGFLFILYALFHAFGFHIADTKGSALLRSGGLSWVDYLASSHCWQLGFVRRQRLAGSAGRKGD